MFRRRVIGANSILVLIVNMPPVIAIPTAVGRTMGTLLGSGARRKDIA